MSNKKCTISQPPNINELTCPCGKQYATLQLMKQHIRYYCKPNLDCKVDDGFACNII